MQLQIKKTYYVNLYEIDQAYGGAEEGGWWFTCGEFIRSHSFMFTDRIEARTRMELLNARTDIVANDPRGSRAQLSSVTCEGRYNWCVEDHPGENFPQERPFYE